MKHNFGVIFDMDGVLVDSNPVHKEVIKEFCKKYQKKTSDEVLKERVYGRTNKEWIPEVFGEITDEYSKELADEKEQMFRDTFDPKSAMIPGLVHFLENLYQDRIKCVVATSAPKENADFILYELDIEKYFSAVLDSSDVDKGKPEPEIYIKAAASIELPANQCIIFEDSLSGVEAGIRAGSKVIGITSTHSTDELSNCDKVIANFNEISVEGLLEIL